MSERPKGLDLFSGAGGCSVGYDWAGFDMTGVDVEPMPNYPFTFHQADALEFLAGHWREFDFIHASPPCQAYAGVTAWRGDRSTHPDLVSATRDALNATGVPWVIENVPEAPIRRDYLLCGTQFGLLIRRHRAFEIGGWTRPFRLVPPCNCYRNPELIPFEHKDERAFADALGCPWMTVREGRQAIPPVFTELIGSDLLAVLASLDGRVSA